MINWQHLAVAASALSILTAMVILGIRKGKNRKYRDFTRKLETLLQPKEVVQVICPQRGSRWILTNSRLIFERKEEFQAFPLKNIKSVQGTNAAGNRTTAVKNMVSMTVKMETDRVLRNTCPEFSQLASALQEKIKKQNQKKKQNPGL